MISLFHNASIANAIAWIFGSVGVVINAYVFLNTSINIRKPNVTVVNVSSDTGTWLTHPRRVNRSIGSQVFMILIANLAVSDFLGASYLLILAGADLHYRLMTSDSNNSSTTLTNSSVLYLGWVNSAGCYVARYLYIISINQSNYITLLIAIDRYLSVTSIHSNKVKLTPFRAKIAVGIGWFIASCIAIICNIYYSAAPITPNQIKFHYHNLCIFDNINEYFVRLTIFVLNILGTVMYVIVVYLYVMIVYKFRQANSNSGLARRDSNSMAERKILIISILITVSNSMSWFPAISSAAALFVSYPLAVEKVDVLKFSPIFFFSYQINCTLNPIIYLFSTSKMSYCKSRSCGKS